MLYLRLFLRVIYYFCTPANLNLGLLLCKTLGNRLGLHNVLVLGTRRLVGLVRKARPGFVFVDDLAGVERRWELDDDLGRRRHDVANQQAEREREQEVLEVDPAEYAHRNTVYRYLGLGLFDTAFFDGLRDDFGLVSGVSCVGEWSKNDRRIVEE